MLASQELRDAIDSGWISAGDFRIRPEAVQPASIDLRLGDFAWALRCSFLPDVESPVTDKLDDIAFQKIDLRDGATLERDRPYLIPLIEELALPPEIRAKANPKSSTGRLDVFTRVITDRHHRFDEIRPGYRGKLYLEVVPRSFAIYVRQGLALNQLRLSTGDARLDDSDLVALHQQFPLLYVDQHPLRESELAIADGLFLSVDLRSGPDRVVGFRAKKNSLPIDLGRRSAPTAGSDFWDPVHPEEGSRIVLEPEIFYLLLSAEGACIPPGYAAEMMAYDPTAGELRTHYAGFFDPGLRLRRAQRPPRQPRGARGPGPRRAVHGRAPPADLQARVRAHERGSRRPLRRGCRLQLPGPGDHAQQALSRAGRRRGARRRLKAGARSGAADRSTIRADAKHRTTRARDRAGDRAGDLRPQAPARPRQVAGLGHA